MKKKETVLPLRLTYAQIETLGWIKGNKLLYSHDFTRRRYSLKPVAALERLGLVQVVKWSKVKQISITQLGSEIHDQIISVINDYSFHDQSSPRDRIKIILKLVGNIPLPAPGTDNNQQQPDEPQKVVKTHANWEGDLDEYLQINDLVDDEMVNYFSNIVPPATLKSSIIQIGSIDDHIEGRATYATLRKSDDGWIFAGYCYRGCTDNVIPKVTY
ncbi:hypothetical protein [Paenibacillus periandrae]|uniref:hypothetical protein n=1 Tax=Paenibacillus periandrae TaxID=1761741 RepID=UPI001F091AFA|nr:hypothetical protein [Paenibacillus periandrae]